MLVKNRKKPYSGGGYYFISECVAPRPLATSKEASRQISTNMCTPLGATRD